MYVWTGEEWVEISSACGGSGAGSGGGGIIYTRDVKTLPDSGQLPLEDQFAELNKTEQNRDDQNPLPDQKAVNEEVLYSLFNQRRKTTRSRTTTDFLQNTVTEGEWTFDYDAASGQLPEEGEFNPQDINGDQTNVWGDAVKININGTGRNSESLADIRRGVRLSTSSTLF